jgi:hypothetical protein
MKIPSSLSLPFFLTLVLILFLAGSVQAAPRTNETRANETLPVEWHSVLAVDEVGQTNGLSPAADLLAVELGHRRDNGRAVLRFSFLALNEDVPGNLARAFVAAGRPEAIEVEVREEGSRSRPLAAFAIRSTDRQYTLAAADKAAGNLFVLPADPDAIYLVLEDDPVLTGATTFAISTRQPNGAGDTVTAAFPADRAYEANCAFVLHGNQGIGYTDVLHGRSDDLEGSGFDEAMQVHEATGVPGNFHMSGTLMTSAEWAARNGDPMDFNAWLTTGVNDGWAGMITSAYGQHIMPFVNNEMNDWSVNIQAQMVQSFYGYTPRVAWVPERVWLNTSGYPSAGVNDWIGDNWQGHGIWGVILDDDVHLAGHDNHQIHTLDANGLRLIPRDRTFTGNIIGGNGQGSLDILSGLAGSGVGEFRIAVFAEDWEAAAEMGGWADITPNANDTYNWMIGKCSTESSWLNTWKLADALSNPNFNGSTISVTPGTYHEIGGFDGYGGGDNGWYTHWAGFVPWANGGDGYGNCGGGAGNCKNYGTLWNDAYTALLNAPDNNLSQAGWYVLMTNLHETAWHDGLGADISGWQHKYSSHIKNAMIYAEASHWAGGEYLTTTNCYTSDIDNDGHDEVVIHNDRLFGVIEGNGGRLTHLFVKGPGYDDTAVGNDNAYWSGTEGDYNDDNHVGVFSDVSPNYAGLSYAWSCTSSPEEKGPQARVTLTHNEVTKVLTLTEGDTHLDVTYEVGPATHWIQGGFSPSLVDLVWNGELERIWPADASYMGFRNPNTGIGTAWVLGTGGASHQKEIAATLMKGDEIKGSGVFQLQLYAGPMTAPDGSGEVAELRTLSDNLTDTLGPEVVESQYYPLSDTWIVTFDQPATVGDVTGFAVGDGVNPLEGLPPGTVVQENGATLTKTLLLDEVTAADVEAKIAAGDIYCTLAAGTVEDESGNPNEALLTGDGLLIEVITTAIAIDGNIQAAEWEGAQALQDSLDSDWTSSNEIDRLLVKWDADYLYVAIDGQVSGNSWLLYLDVDPGSASGETDLTAIDAWERGASFTATDFAADFQYGCYQHQSPYDGDGFWQLLSATTTQDRSGEISSAFDSFHNFGDSSGSELAIPWNTLYGLGAGSVPAGAQISLVASVTWDPEPGGELGGDSVPSNLTAALPVIDNVWTLTVDANGDGVPDGSGPAPVPDLPVASGRLLPNYPNPFNPATTLHYEIGGHAAAHVKLVIYDVRGRHVTTLVDDLVEPGLHRVVWDGTSGAGRPVASGTYYSQMQWRGQVSTRPLSLVK